MIASGSLLAVVGLFFGLGLLLAFTPCVLPMVPILSGLIIGQGDRATPRRSFMLSLVYVLAMALTYTVAGVVVALLGHNLQAAFQHPAVIIGFSAVFVALALAMFGAWDFQIFLLLFFLSFTSLFFASGSFGSLSFSFPFAFSSSSFTSLFFASGSFGFLFLLSISFVFSLSFFFFPLFHIVLLCSLSP